MAEDKGKAIQTEVGSFAAERLLARLIRCGLSGTFCLVFRNVEMSIIAPHVIKKEIYKYIKYKGQFFFFFLFDE